MYNKQPTLLRVETTFNDGRGLKVYRPKQDDPQEKPQWLPLRKTVADLPRRAQLSQASNWCESERGPGDSSPAMGR